ncbi:hypothetical protein H0H81_012016, partial [Sphagnurus paluster]
SVTHGVVCPIYSTAFRHTDQWQTKKRMMKTAIKAKPRSASGIWKAMRASMPKAAGDDSDDDADSDEDDLDDDLPSDFDVDVDDSDEDEEAAAEDDDDDALSLI